MLIFGVLQPKLGGTHFTHKAKVDLTPWRYGWAASSTMFAGIICLYLLFSPIGLVGGLSAYFWLSVIVVMIFNVFICTWTLQIYDRKLASPL